MLIIILFILPLYSMRNEGLSKLEGFTTNTKSFISCAVGKIGS